MICAPSRRAAADSVARPASTRSARSSPVCRSVLVDDTVTSKADRSVTIRPCTVASMAPPRSRPASAAKGARSAASSDRVPSTTGTGPDRSIAVSALPSIPSPENSPATVQAASAPLAVNFAVTGPGSPGRISVVSRSVALAETSPPTGVIPPGPRSTRPVPSTSSASLANFSRGTRIASPSRTAAASSTVRPFSRASTRSIPVLRPSIVPSTARSKALRSVTAEPLARRSIPPASSRPTRPENGARSATCASMVPATRIASPTGATSASACSSRSGPVTSAITATLSRGPVARRCASIGPATSGAITSARVSIASSVAATRLSVMLASPVALTPSEVTLKLRRCVPLSSRRAASATCASPASSVSTSGMPTATSWPTPSRVMSNSPDSGW